MGAPRQPHRDPAETMAHTGCTLPPLARKILGKRSRPAMRGLVLLYRHESKITVRVEDEDDESCLRDVVMLDDDGAGYYDHVHLRRPDGTYSSVRSAGLRSLASLFAAPLHPADVLGKRSRRVWIDPRRIHPRTDAEPEAGAVSEPEAKAAAEPVTEPVTEARTDAGTAAALEALMRALLAGRESVGVRDIHGAWWAPENAERRRASHRFPERNTKRLTWFVKEHLSQEEGDDGDMPFLRRRDANGEWAYSERRRADLGAAVAGLLARVEALERRLGEPCAKRA